MRLKVFILFTTLIIITNLGYGQSGLNVYTGISQAKNQSKLITPEGQAHPGYHIGADARLNRDNMYFMIGGQYHVIHFLSQESGSFFSVSDKMNWTKIRFGLGYNLISFDQKINIRAKTLASINLITKHPELSFAPFQIYNSGTAGAVLGIGVDVYAFTFDLEYEKGFFNAVNKVEGTEYNFLTASVGVRF